MALLMKSDHFISLERGDVLTAVNVYTAATGGVPTVAGKQRHELHPKGSSLVTGCLDEAPGGDV